ncbi:MAG: pyrroline-5-carboxylate reductase [Christensenellaceae bacterium]|jgi:pyrroline-5-carboxylate reductase
MGNTYKIGFIGAGNMAEAIFAGALKKGVVAASQISIYDINLERLASLKNTYKVHTVTGLEPLLHENDILILAVKPHVAKEILPSLKTNASIVSIVAGLSYDAIQQLLPQETKLLRIMPNTPHMVGEGVAAFALPYTLEEKQASSVKMLFEAIGIVISVEERLMDAVTGMSGSGPAYGYLFIEAMADAGVKNGLPRETAYQLAAQTLLGAAKMVLATGEHPGKLKDDVCSPGGTTIAAVSKLEKNGFRNAIIAAVDAATEKSKNL